MIWIRILFVTLEKLIDIETTLSVNELSFPARY